MNSVSMRDTAVPDSRNQIQSTELKILLHVIIKIQRWWRTMMLKSRTEAAIVIQSHFRGWIARRRAAREKRLIVVIQVRSSLIHFLTAPGHFISLFTMV